MICHAGRSRSLPLPILALALAVIEQSFGTMLIAPVGRTLLLEAGLPSALVAAIAMATITV